MNKTTSSGWKNCTGLTAVACPLPVAQHCSCTTTGTQGSKLEYHQLDISKPDSVAAFAAWLKQQHGKLDILVNNAGGVSNCTLVNNIPANMTPWIRHQTWPLRPCACAPVPARVLVLVCLGCQMRTQLTHTACLFVYTSTGIAYKGNTFGPEEAQTTLATNFGGTKAVCEALAWPLMTKGGRIVNVSST